MILFRYVGLGLCCSAVLLTFLEIYRYVETHVFAPLTLAEAWLWKYDQSLGSIIVMGGKGGLASFIAEFMDAVITMPLLSLVLGVGLFLVFISRHCEAGE
ncbi:MAG: hypothetical protein COB54_00695 [Alphaproteobacteria bacterium]|nr:MAG: hypothetical protein COB54_00695 [Alphaproteobacteria bacterium]